MITPWRVIYLLILGVCLFFILKQHGGWNFDIEYQGYREKMERLNTDEDERRIAKQFRRIQALNRNYLIGIVAVTDYRPTFGGEDYRVYDIGYYDMDKRVRHLMHITCAQGRIRKFDPVTAREPAAPEFIK